MQKEKVKFNCTFSLCFCSKIDSDKGLQHAMGMGKPNPADAHKYAQGTGGVSDYDKGLQHAMGMGKQNPADAHKYAQGTGGVKRVTDESLQMARNPENAYGIGTGGAKRTMCSLKCN